jgi:hypothetical protein
MNSERNEDSEQVVLEIMSEDFNVSETNTMCDNKNNVNEQLPSTNNKKKVNPDILKKKYTGLNSQINVALIEDKLSKKITEIDVHPSVSSLPKSSNAEFMALEADIKERGLINPIILNMNEQCIDGRARLEILCKNPSVTPHIIKINISDDEVLEYTVRQNLIRRHLNNGQRAVLAVKIYEYIKEQRKNDKEFTFLGIKVGIGERSRKSVAKYFSICETILGKTYTIFKNSPELLDAIMEDTITFEGAYNLAIGKSEIRKVSSEAEIIKVSSVAEINEISPEEYDENEEFDNAGNETPSQSSSTSNEEANEIVRKYEETKKGKQTTDSEEIKSAKLTPREEFEKTYRCLKPLEATFLEFLKNDLNIAKSEESLTAILIKEEQNKKALTIKRTDDENFDKLCQIFMDLVLTEKLSENEQLNCRSMIEQVKNERVQNETMTFEEQIEKLNSVLNDDGKVLIELAKIQFEEKAKNELNFESTLYGKLFNFILKCKELINPELNLRVA